MSDNVFLDSNVLVYSYSNSELDKQLIARKLIAESNSFISTQVLQELCNIVTRKFKFSYEQAITVINESFRNNNLHTNTELTIIQACRLADRYGFSFYDSMIISAAIECNCSILFSEDLHDGQTISGSLLIKNPFATSK
jgi:predicted nucleic acid-binding protein